MSDIFEVAFSGQIAEGADLEQVKQNIAKMFKADDAKLAQLFSGKRIVIKKNIDQQTAVKYQTAMQKAGAICELANLSQSEPEADVAPSPPPVKDEPPAVSATSSAVDYSGRDIPPAPQTVPLDIRAEQIDDLPADLAPVGSVMQDHVEVQAELPEVPDDITVAPAGSDLGEAEEKPAPPLPDTSSLSLIDN